MTAPVLEVRNLSKHFSVRARGFGRKTATIRAVDDVSLTLEPGETLGLVGESGCGKSTLGRTILRLLDPTDGEVLVEGRDITGRDTSHLRSRVQMIFQDPYTSLPPKMRVGRILAEPLLIHQTVPPDRIQERVDSLLADVGLKTEHARALPRQLSGGQRQRVSIARALAVEPSLIVADEAVSALDVSVQAQILNLLKRLQEDKGIAYLFISHDLGVVRYMSHRIAVMYLGRLLELGPADDLTRRPLNPYTKALLEAVPKVGVGKSVTVGIESEPPNPADPPSGCAFHPRCPMAQDICARERPEPLEWRPGRWSACHFALEVGGGAHQSDQQEAPRVTGSAT